MTPVEFLALCLLVAAAMLLTIRLAGRRKPEVADVSEPTQLTSGRPVVEAFARCPTCGTEAHHLMIGLRTVVETDQVFQPDPNDPGEVVEIAQWGMPSHIRRVVSGGGRFVDVPRLVSVVDRECLLCGKKWEELA